MSSSSSKGDEKKKAKWTPNYGCWATEADAKLVLAHCQNLVASSRPPLPAWRISSTLYPSRSNIFFKLY
jgi:hypothetical protein